MKPISKLKVKLDGRLVGTLALPPNHAYQFVYDADWLANGFNLSPMHMAFSSNPQAAPSREFSGLHGVFNDSLPDGWGLLLMDRFFRQQWALAPHDVTALERLAYMGDRAMGALEYEPEIEDSPASETLDVAALFQESVRVLTDDSTEVIRQMRLAGGSPGGARPKITLGFSEDMHKAVSSFRQLPAGYNHWLLKYRGKAESRDSGAIEYIYSRLAKDAGIAMPDTRLLHVQCDGSYERFFATCRFDREGQRKLHMMTASGVLYASHRTISLDYADLLKLASHITGSSAEVIRMAKLMIFNILSVNKDDHTKNFSFICDAGQWRLAPAYDLTFAPQPYGGNHSTAVNGATLPRRSDIIKVCRSFPYLKPDDYLAEIHQALAKWPEYAGQYQINRQDAQDIAVALDAAWRRME